MKKLALIALGLSVLGSASARAGESTLRVECRETTSSEYAQIRLYEQSGPGMKPARVETKDDRGVASSFELGMLDLERGVPLKAQPGFPESFLVRIQHSFFLYTYSDYDMPPTVDGIDCFEF